MKYLGFIIIGIALSGCCWTKHCKHDKHHKSKTVSIASVPEPDPIPTPPPPAEMTPPEMLDAMMGQKDFRSDYVDMAQMMQ